MACDPQPDDSYDQASLRETMARLEKDLHEDQREMFGPIGGQLMKLNARGKDNFEHTLLQLICAKYLIKEGYRVFVEYDKAAPFVCDIKAVKPSEDDLNIEIETGLSHYQRMYSKTGDIRHLVDMKNYRKAREISKAARYSHISKKFGFGVPASYRLQLPEEFSYEPEDRNNNRTDEYKRLCDCYSRKKGTPRVSSGQISSAKVDYVFLIDTDNLTVVRKSFKEYLSAYRVAHISL